MRKLVIVIAAVVAVVTLVNGISLGAECPPGWELGPWNWVYGKHPNINTAETRAWDTAEAECEEDLPPNCHCCYSFEGCVYIPPSGFLLAHWQCRVKWAHCCWTGQ